MAIEKVRGGSFVGRSGTRDSAKKFEALANVDGVREKGRSTIYTFFFLPQYADRRREILQRDRTG